MDANLVFTLLTISFTTIVCVCVLSLAIIEVTKIENGEKK